MELAKPLNSDLKDYFALARLCGGERGDFVLGAALDAAAGVMALNLDDTLFPSRCREQLANEVDASSYSRGRDSLALAPALSLIKAGAPISDVRQAVDIGRQKRYVDPVSSSQFVEVAWADLSLLIALTGENGKFGEIMFAARIAGKRVYRNLKHMANIVTVATGENCQPISGAGPVSERK